MLKSLISKIQYYHWCLVSRSFFRNLSNQFVYLEQGCYYVVCCHREYLVKEGLSDEILKMVGINSSCPHLSGLKVIREESDSKLFRAQMIMSTHGGQRYFDFTNNETFRLFSDTNEYETYKKGIEAFKPFFKCPDLHYTEQYCIEKIIRNKPREEWSTTETVELFNSVLNNYINYLKSANKYKIDIQDVEVLNKTDVKDYSKLSNELKDFVNRSPLKIPSVLCHCDLHFGNTLFDGESIFLIDFENVRDDVFFYDLFNVMFVEYIDKNNPFFIDSYFTENSEVDYLFKQAFHAVGEVLEEKHRVLYFVVFLLSRLSHNVSYLESHLEDEMLNRPIQDTVNHIKKVFDYITRYEKKV